MRCPLSLRERGRVRGKAACNSHGLVALPGVELCAPSLIDFIGSSPARWFAERFFPLTPALSLGERENRPPLSGESNALGRAGVSALNRGAHGASGSEVRLKKDAGCWFPLPRERQGEGERDAANQNGRTNFASSTRPAPRVRVGDHIERRACRWRKRLPSHGSLMPDGSGIETNALPNSIRRGRGLSLPRAWANFAACERSDCANIATCCVSLMAGSFCWPGLWPWHSPEWPPRTELNRLVPATQNAA